MVATQQKSTKKMKLAYLPNLSTLIELQLMKRLHGQLLRDMLEPGLWSPPTYERLYIKSTPLWVVWQCLIAGARLECKYPFSFHSYTTSLL